jgi:CRISPR system Cascade subunit CasD
VTQTLLLRLCGPLQAWGIGSRFEQRDSGLEPSKSGVVGLLAAALGRPRGANLADLAALRMGVRVLQPGRLMSDFQTAGGTHRPGDSYGVARFDGSAPQGVLLLKHYLADADFLVGLESADAAWLARLHAAVQRPRWPLFLGRKAYAPSLPVAVPDAPPWGPPIRPLDLRGALLSWPWSPEATEALCIYEDPAGMDQRHDQPVSFAWEQTLYVMRSVQTVREPRPPDALEAI